MPFNRIEKRGRRLRAKLPAAYRRWPWLAGVAVGLWFMVLVYLARVVLSLVRGDSQTAAFSLLWSALCFVFWTLLHNWARKHQAG